MLLCIRCLTDMDQWQMYDNTVHNVNTATQHGGQIFSVLSFYFYFILQTSQAFWLFTSYGNSSLCTCLWSLNSNFLINITSL